MSGNDSTFKLDIVANEDEIKDLLKEDSKSENTENTSNYINNIDDTSSSPEKENDEFDKIDFNESDGQDF
jgi:hypothetical protein